MAESEDKGSEKTLEPTERRLQKAREEGQFPQSRDLTTLAILAVTMFYVMVAGGWLIDTLVGVVKLAFTFDAPDRFKDFLAMWSAEAVVAIGGVVGLLIFACWLFAMLAPLALINLRPVFVLKFRGSRLNPIAGLGRMMSVQTLAELIKTIFKAGLILLVGFLYIGGLVGAVRSLARLDFIEAVAEAGQMILKGAALLLLPLAVIAVADAFWQWYSFRKQMRMTFQEVKDEMKESEGSPEVRGRLRQRQRQIAMNRMMSAVEKADVVLANPEHFAVALRYEEGKMAAPVVVAKGTDEIALRIRELAAEHGVPVARSPALARLMYAKVEIGHPVPGPLFEAIAKVLAWAYQVREGDIGRDVPDVGVLPELM